MEEIIKRTHESLAVLGAGDVSSLARRRVWVVSELSCYSNWNKRTRGGKSPELIQKWQKKTVTLRLAKGLGRQTAGRKQKDCQRGDEYSNSVLEGALRDRLASKHASTFLQITRPMSSGRWHFMQRLCLTSPRTMEWPGTSNWNGSTQMPRALATQHRNLTHWCMFLDQMLQACKKEGGMGSVTGKQVF